MEDLLYKCRGIKRYYITLLMKISSNNPQINYIDIIIPERLITYELQKRMESQQH